MRPGAADGADAVHRHSFAEPLQRVFDDVLRPDHDLDVSHVAESRYFEQAITYRSRSTTPSSAAPTGR